MQTSIFWICGKDWLKQFMWKPWMWDGWDRWLINIFLLKYTMHSLAKKAQIQSSEVGFITKMITVSCCLEWESLPVFTAAAGTLVQWPALVWCLVIFSIKKALELFFRNPLISVRTLEMKRINQQSENTFQFAGEAMWYSGANRITGFREHWGQIPFYCI